jgi:deoxyribonuclease-4
MFVGSHIDTKKYGLLRSLQGLEQFGVTSCQVLLKYDTMKSAPAVKQYIEEKNLKVFSHIPFTLNFAKDALAEEPYWIERTKRELRIANAMGFIGCVIHVGKAVNLDRHQATENMFNNFSTVVDYIISKGLSSKLLIETASGQGTELCTDLDSFSAFYNRFTDEQKEHIGICIDTAHIWAAGADLRSYESVQQYINDVNQKIGLQHCHLVHLNNSKVVFGGKVDRHEDLHVGKIPFASLEEFVKIIHYHNIPLVLETPKGLYDVATLAKMLGKELPKFNETEYMFACLK